MKIPTPDHEIATLKRVYKLMKDFDYASQARMQQWLQQRFDADEKYRDVLSRTETRINGYAVQHSGDGA